MCSRNDTLGPPTPNSEGLVLVNSQYLANVIPEETCFFLFDFSGQSTLGHQVILNVVVEELTEAQLLCIDI